MAEAVVFYSCDGNTKLAAQAIAQKLAAHIFEIEETKKRKIKGFGFIRAGFGATLGKKSPIKNTFSDEMKNYDKLFIGTPVWAGKAAPAINAFIDTLDAAGKKVAIFTVQADPKPDESSAPCADIMKKILESRGAVIIKTIKLCGANPGKTVEKAEIQKQIDEKL